MRSRHNRQALKIRPRNAVHLTITIKMPKKPNYNFEKRRKEMARKEKQEEKRTRKREAEELPEPNESSVPGAPSNPPEE